MSLSSLLLLMFLLRGDCSPSVIIKELGTTKSNLSQRANKLEREGFIERKKTKGDQRVTLFGLTKKGKAIAASFLISVKDIDVEWYLRMRIALMAAAKCTK